jgi:hypothetical protein
MVIQSVQVMVIGCASWMFNTADDPDDEKALYVECYWFEASDAAEHGISLDALEAMNGKRTWRDDTAAAILGTLHEAPWVTKWEGNVIPDGIRVPEDRAIVKQIVLVM